MSDCDITSIAVVIPIKNRHNRIIATLQSVFDQTRPADEIIVVDDGSNPAIELPVGDRSFDRVRVIRLDQQVGASEARNIGTRSSTCGIIAFLDSDDAYLPRHLANVEGAFRSDPGAVFVSTRMMLVDGDARPLRLIGTTRSTITHRDLLEEGNIVGSSSAIAVPRDRLLAAGGFPPIKSCQEWALLLALTRLGSGVQVMPATVCYSSPHLSRLDNISRRYGMYPPSWQYVFHAFDFKTSAKARRHRLEVMTLLFAVNGRRRTATYLLARLLKSGFPSRLSVRSLIAVMFGKRAYYAAMALKARASRLFLCFER